MNRFVSVLALSLTTLSAHAQSPLVGTWRSVEADAEVVEFRADGSGAFDGRTLSYRASDTHLMLSIDGKTLLGTWEVAGSELTISLDLPNGETTAGQYRRVGRKPPPPEPEDDGSARERAGDATFALPRGWTVTSRNETNAGINPGLPDGDRVDALVAVLTGTVDQEHAGLGIGQLMRARLDDLAAELAQVQVEMTSRPRISVVDLGGGERGAQLQATGMASGTQPVTVWVGARRSDTQYAAVFAIVVEGEEARFLGGAQTIMRSIEFVAGEPDGPGGGGGGGGAELAGREFSHASFYGGSGSTTVVYAFYGDGSVKRTRTSSTGYASEAVGSYTVDGDTVTIAIDGETLQSAIERNGAAVTALRIGGTRYE